MTAFDDTLTLDADRMLNDLYAMQVSLRMIFDQLARTRPPEWNLELLNSMLTLHQVMLQQQPSLRRH